MRKLPHRSPSGDAMPPKYPKTPYWPYSPDLGRRAQPLVHADPDRFVGREVVVTEKLDGGNTLVHRGRVYGRSVTEPSTAGWMAMVKKHTAWKVHEDDHFLYGEDIYAIHSIEYGPVPADRTFHAFALRRGDRFASFAELEAYACDRGIPVVPVLHRGRFASVGRIREFIEAAHRQPSELGGGREGVVLRVASGFDARDFALNVCKSVRNEHLATKKGWTRHWRPCNILPPSGDATSTGDL